MTLTSLIIEAATLYSSPIRPAALEWDQWNALCHSDYDKQIEELVIFKPHRLFQEELRGLWVSVQELLVTEVL